MVHHALIYYVKVVQVNKIVSPKNNSGIIQMLTLHLKNEEIAVRPQRKEAGFSMRRKKLCGGQAYQL
jgi:uncharacterized protein (UPF0332 family)